MRTPHHPWRGQALIQLIASAALLVACSNAPNPALPTPTTAATASVTILSLPAEPSPTSWPCFTREALAAMTLVEIAALPRICYQSQDGVETQIDQAKAVDAIHAFLQEDRLLGFREITRMANSPDGLLRVARLEDDEGRSYLVAVAANRVLEMDPGAAVPAIDGPRLSPEDL